MLMLIVQVLVLEVVCNMMIVCLGLILLDLIPVLIYHKVVVVFYSQVVLLYVVLELV